MARRSLMARCYPRMADRMMRAGQAEHRRELLGGLAGRVVEVGPAHGVNFAFYPETVTEVVAVEPDAGLRELAAAAARLAPVKVEVVEGEADALPGEDGSFDAAVASLVLCSVPDQGHALAELRRVLRPGGELRFYEHVHAGGGLASVVQRALDATIWPHVAGGCHLGRDTRAAVEAAGFEIEECEERHLRMPRAMHALFPHVLGRAHVPAPGGVG